MTDPLYSLFEQHLYDALVENESTEAFLEHVVKDYMRTLSSAGALLTAYVRDIETDVRDEVLEMLRKKTYGHYSLDHYRQARRRVGP